MPTPFANVIQGIQDRLGALTANSPFSANPLGGVNPFAGGSPLGGGSSPFSQNPFGSNGGGIFNGNPFGAGSNPFANSPWQGGGNVFGNPFGNTNVFNPYAASKTDPFGTGILKAQQQQAQQQANGTGTGYTMNFTGPATSDDNKSLTGQQIDNWIHSTQPNSPLAGQGQFILDEANKRGISVPMLLGIMSLESQLGTTGSLPQYYNYGGLTGSSWGGQTGTTVGMARDFAKFGNMQDGLRALMDNLATSTYKGKSVQQQIGTWYLGNPNADLNATDEQGNASMAEYLAVVGKAYQGLNVGYNASQAPTATSSGKVGNNPNWEQTAMSFTRQGGHWVDYTMGGIRDTGNPADGFDCSSFTGYVLNLPRNEWNAQAQYNAAQARGTVFTDLSKAQKGDLIFFTGTYDAGTPVTHVGIYLGNGQMIHTGSPGRGVEIVPVSSLQKYFYGIGRL